MKVLLCLCACIAAATGHGVIGYPAVPLAYHNYITPLTTITRPLGVTYTGGYPVPVGPYFSYNLAPNNLIFPVVPGVVHYIPLAPPKGKGKPDKKMPGGKGNKDSKEETTEESKTEEAETKTEETEDLAH